VLRNPIPEGMGKHRQGREVQVRPAIKLICPNGCPAHIDRSLDFEAKAIVGKCRGCGAKAIEPKEEAK
jgi:hypothetical protein